MKYVLSIFFLFSGTLQAIPPKESALEALLIEGKLSRAEMMAGELPLESARRYYRAWIAHIRGDYARGLRELSWRKFGIENYYPRVCQLKVIHLWKMGEGKKFDWEADICLSEVSRFSPNGMLWIQSLRPMAGGKGGRMDPFFFGDRGAEIWLKAGIYFQRDDLVEKTFFQLSSPKEEGASMKELIALHYYRQGHYKKAFEWAAGISGVNASNILGRIYLAGGDFKSSWKHFNEAVKIRRDSRNALEYLPSLAWILGHWKEGREFLLQLSRLRELTLEELALLSAFYIQEENFRDARRGLGMLEKRFDNVLPMEGLLLGGYISLREGRDLVSYSLPACLQSEGIHCWLLLQQSLWEDFEGLAERDEFVFGGEEPDIDSYRREVVVSPLKEKIYVLSKDIEELDRRELNAGSDPHP